MKISFLYGVRLDRLIKLAIRHGGVSFSRIPSFIVHIFYGISTLILSIPDFFWKDRGLPKDITFILGHYRSGTSHLLNVLTEEGTHVSPSNFHCLFPHSFLSTEFFLAPLLNLVAPQKRPMDNMTMTMESPQEEEIGLAAMGVPTPYLSVHFPKSDQYYRDLISFKNASKQDLNQWKKAHNYLLRKLAKRYGPDQPLVLKSPTNTARIRLLLEMYPNAKFIHIHRDPYRTIQSSIHLYNVWYEMDHFQSLAKMKENLTENVMDVYEEISRAWLTDHELIPENRRISISFAELQSDPLGTMRNVYQHLGRPFNEEKLAQYLSTITSYQKNQYEKMSPEIIEEINQRFDFIFKGHGYNKKERV